MSCTQITCDPQIYFFSVKADLIGGIDEGIKLIKNIQILPFFTNYNAGMLKYDNVTALMQYRFNKTIIISLFVCVAYLTSHIQIINFFWLTTGTELLYKVAIISNPHFLIP